MYSGRCHCFTWLFLISLLGEGRKIFEKFGNSEPWFFFDRLKTRPLSWFLLYLNSAFGNLSHNARPERPIFRRPKFADRNECAVIRILAGRGFSQSPVAKLTGIHGSGLSQNFQNLKQIHFLSGVISDCPLLAFRAYVVKPLETTVQLGFRLVPPEFGTRPAYYRIVKSKRSFCHQISAKECLC